VRKPSVDRVVRKLAGQIRTARIEAGLTQEEAAERGGIPYKRFQSIEHGAANVTVKTLARISAAVGLTISQLTGLTASRRRTRGPGRPTSTRRARA
jgi:transcriptional regulator with XRE-family HTH domain